jgi:hypothetical protein
MWRWTIEAEWGGEVRRAACEEEEERAREELDCEEETYKTGMVRCISGELWVLLFPNSCQRVSSFNSAHYLRKTMIGCNEVVFWWRATCLDSSQGRELII